MSVVEETRKLLQDFLAPELRELKGSIHALDARLGAFETKFQARADAFEAKLQASRAENARNFEKLNSKLNLLLNLHSIEQRLARLEQRSA